MYDVNVKKYVEPLTDINWDKKDRNIIDKLKLTLKDFLYFRCVSKILPNYSEHIFMSLITSLKFKKYKPHEIILNYNDIVDKIYFIINGKLNIYRISVSKINFILINICKKQKSADKRKQIIDYFNTYVKRYLNTISDKSIFLNYKKKNNNNNKRNSVYNINKNKKRLISELEHFYRVIINENKIYDYSLEEGKIFGEEYIYNDIQYSNCILESDSDSIIGLLDKDDYEKIYKRVNIIERSYITAFLVKLKIFNSSNFFLPKLQKCLIKRNFAKNEIIFKQNEIFRTFYVIRQGKVNLSLKIPKKVNCKLEPEIIIGNQKNKRFLSNNSFIVKGEYLEKNEYNLITVENGEFIGEIEYYNQKDKYMYTAQCIEDDCILFEFDLFLFEHLIKNNESINMNLKGFFEKIKEKMALLQDRIYNNKRSGSAIKKSDYVLSKNKFTRNLLQNNPIKEDKKDKTYFNISINNDKINNSNFIYYSAFSPIFKKHTSVNRNKKFNKIQINNCFFNSRSNEGKRYNSKSTSKSRRTSKERNISSANTSNNISKILLYKKNIINKSSKENISRNIICDIDKDRNENIKDYINSTSYSVKKPMKKNNIFNSFNKFKKRNLSNKLKKLYINCNNNQNSFDFLDPNLDCNGNDKLKNIPIILKETKKCKIYQNIYNKDRIKKLNSFYFKSPQNFHVNKIPKKTE